MSEYMFRTCDLEECSEYPSPVLVCTPEICKICGISEDNTMLYETILNPLCKGDFQCTVKITNWPIIEDYSIVTVTQNQLIFDGECSIKSIHAVHLESVLPSSMYILKLPQKIKEYSGALLFYKEGGDVFVLLVDIEIILKINVLFTNSKTDFSVQIRSEFLEDYISKGFIKIYLETDFPICIEDGTHRTFIAPCVN